MTESKAQVHYEKWFFIARDPKRNFPWGTLALYGSEEEKLEALGEAFKAGYEKGFEDAQKENN